MDFIRLYHFLPAKWAVEDLEQKRIKLSEVENLNDPFELWCMKHEDAKVRKELRRWKTEAAKKYALLCFSKNWSNSLLWSHYGDKHKGVCLGLDVRSDSVKKVRYTRERVRLSSTFDERTTNTLLFTKSTGWSYEEEWRMWARLEERDPKTNFCYYEFDENISLREVIAGPLCETSKKDFVQAIGDTTGVKLIKSRLALKSFKVTTDLRGF